MTKLEQVQALKAELSRMELDVDRLDPKELLEEHFDLMDLKRNVENKIKTNHAQMVRVLVKAEMFDALTVNWRQLDQRLQNRS